MTLQELVWSIDGAQHRDAKRQEPFRLLYWVIYNSNAKKPKTFRALQEEWPLYTDKLDNSMPDKEEMNQAWERLQSAGDGRGRDQSNI